MKFTMTSGKEQWAILRAKPLIFILLESLFAFILGGTALLFASVSHTGVNMVDLWFKYMDITVFLLNMVPPFLVYWTLLFLLRKPSLVYGLMSLLTAALCLVNYYKISLRNEPLVFSDFSLAFEAVNMVGEYTLEFTTAVGVLVGFLLFSNLLHLYAFPLSYKMPMTWQFTIRSACVVILILALVIRYAIFDEAVYEDTADYRNINRLAFTQVYLARGLWYPFLYSAGTPSEPEFELPEVPEGSETPAAYLVLEDFEPDEEEGIPLGDISVVSIMLEGFCDYSDFAALAKEPGVLEAYEIWHRLSEESVSGNIINTVFGGGTAYTERSYLTGIPGADDEFGQVTDSYVWMFREAGYFTHGAHIGFQDFYNRINVNQNLGFENYYFYEDVYADLVPEERLYNDSDTEFFDSIIDQMEEALIMEQPTFGFYVTIQNHGPYSPASDMSDPYISKSVGMNEEYRARLQTYLTGIEDTLQQIERLESYLNQREDPVMMVLFGDHMPWAGNGDSILLDLGVDIDTSTVEGMLNYYGTPYVIWANEAARQVITGEYPAEGGDFSNHFLMNKLFETVGWTQPPEIAFTSHVMGELPVIFRTWEFAYWLDNKVTVKLPSEEQEWASKFAAYAYQRRAGLYYPDLGK